MGTVPSSVSIASISHGRIFLLILINDPRLCWILAYPVLGGGSSPRHKPARNVCPIFKSSEQPSYIEQPRHRLAVLTDLRFKFMALDHTLFPDVPGHIKVHSGFVIEHMKTADQILAEVERLMDAYSSTSVILVSLTTVNRFPSGTSYLLRSYTCRSVTPLAELSPNSTRCS